LGEGGVRLRVVVAGALGDQVRAVILGLPGVTGGEVTFAGGDVVGILNVDGPDVAEAVAEAVCGRGWRLRALGPAPDDLEAAFLAAVAGSARAIPA
jgi:hypothetical protein